MKTKSFCCLLETKNEHGFVLLPLLLLTAISLIAISYSISVYQNNLQITAYHEESLISDSLYQMAGEKVKEDLPGLNWSDGSIQKEYLFPPGKVTVLLNKTSENQVECYFKMEPVKGKEKSKYKVLAVP